jgi:cytidyltransferase-like protein
MGRSKPIFSVNSIKNLCNDLRLQGKKVGLTHGAFDLFHNSHLDLLKKSAEICDYLIVGIDSDRKVAEYKSYKRPIINQIHRLNIINELSCVDAVFIKDLELEVDPHVRMYKDLQIDIVTVGRISFKGRIKKQCSVAKVIFEEIKTCQNPTTTFIISEIVKRYSYKVGNLVPKEE